jgi:hypothetical protein
MTWRTRASLVGGALTILGACAPPGTTTVLDRAATATSTTRAVTTTAPGPTTTSAEPPVATTPMSDDPRATLAADATATWEVSHRCLAAPEQCDVTAVAVADSPAAAVLRQRLDDLVRERFRTVPGSGPLQLLIESAEVVGDGSGVVVACVTDGLLLVDVADPADPLDDIIFDDSLGSYRWRWVMQHTAVGWRRQSVEQLGYYPGVATCPA